MGKGRVFVSLCVLGLAVAAPGAFAQSRLSTINEKTVTLVAGEPQWFGATVALSRLLKNENGLRVLPVQGDGCIESAADVMQLSQIDVALLTTDCVEYAEQQGLLPSAKKKLAFVARVESLPLIIVTRKEFPTLTSLANKRIATGPAHSAGFASGELLLGGLGLPFARLPRSGTEGLAALKANEVDAVLLQGLHLLDGELDPQRFHVIGLSAPAVDATSYAPALIESAALKGLSATDVETVSTSLVLAVLNAPKNSSKSEKIKLFSGAYFTQQASGDEAPLLSTNIAGWQRHTSAQQALDALPNEPIQTEQGDGP
jgi:uncharacterized protein